MTVQTHIREKEQTGDTVIAWAFDRHSIGALTTEHAASSYGQPVVVREGQVIDYSAIESLTLFPEATAEELAAAQRLEAYGIKVSVHQPTDL